jgi:hypothetical protein
MNRKNKMPARKKKKTRPPAPVGDTAEEGEEGEDNEDEDVEEDDDEEQAGFSGRDHGQKVRYNWIRHPFRLPNMLCGY